jgi:hypothetical protein
MLAWLQISRICLTHLHLLLRGAVLVYDQHWEYLTTSHILVECPFYDQEQHTFHLRAHYETFLGMVFIAH